MGRSTDAILFYGYCWTDESKSLIANNEDGAAEEWHKVVAKRRGISNPWDLYRSSGAEAAHRALPYNQRNVAYRDWERQVGFDALLGTWDKELDKIKAEYGGAVEISSHCSCDYPMPYIYIKDSHLRAKRGSSVMVPSSHMGAATIYWDWALSRFIKDLDIDISDAQGPGWFLVSNWC